MPKSVDTIQVVLPDGSIGITPSQIDIIADDGTTVPAPSKTIRWHKDTVGGPVVAEIIGEYDPGIGRALYQIESLNLDGVGKTFIRLTSFEGPGLNPPSTVFASTRQAGNVGTATIIDSNNDSSFVQRSKISVARAYLNAAQSLPNTGWTKVLLDTESYDPNGDFSTVNKRYTCPRTGYYQVNGNISLAVQNATNFHAVSVFKNGAANPYSQGTMLQNGGALVGWAQGYQVSDIIQCNAGDYLELFGFNNGTAANTPLLNGFAWLNYLSIALISY